MAWTRTHARSLLLTSIVALASSGGGDKIDLDQVVKENVNDQIDALKQVVDENTK